MSTVLHNGVFQMLDDVVENTLEFIFHVLVGVIDEFLYRSHILDNSSNSSGTILHFT